MTTTVDEVRPLSADRVAAAQARAAALGGGVSAAQARSVLPRELGAARLVPAQAQLRAQLQEHDGRQLYRFDGIASVTDQPYRMYDHFGEFDEVVSRRAFSATLAANPDVAFLLNHRGMTMARTANKTLELALTDTGLRAQAWLNPERQDVKDLVIAMNDGDITEMSFAFMLQDGEWSDDFSQFTITRLDIHRGDVSAVNYGANPYTSIAARSQEFLSDIDHLPAGAARAALARLNARDDVREVITVRHETPDVPLKGDTSTGLASYALPAPSERERQLEAAVTDLQQRLDATVAAVPEQVRAALAAERATVQPEPAPTSVDDVAFYAAFARV
jgi:HK97 family phage prohead protease